MDLIFNNIRYYTKQQLIKYFNTEELSILLNLKLYFDDLYYNSNNSIFPDYHYDMFVDIVSNRNNECIQNIGIKPRDKETILPFFLPSMNKIKKEEESKFNNWLSVNNCTSYMVSDKLDGVSCLLYVDNGNIRLYTRGDGISGSDISHIQSYLNLPTFNISHIFSARGELVIKKSNFLKYTDMYTNSRNMITGIIGSKTIKDALIDNDIEFVLYEIVDIIKMPKPSEQLISLYNFGFRTVFNTILTEININNLESILIDRKNICLYDIDGIIVQSNKKYTRPINNNPKYAFAFKINNESVDTTVIKVEWNISKRGLLKPRIKLEPIHLNGVTINYVTGFNAKFIVTNNIGPGSIVSIIRSGDVIPHIVDIISSNIEPQMPEVKYIWNSSNIDIIEVGKNISMDIKILSSMFLSLNVKFVSTATIKKMYNSGLDTFLKIIKVDKNTLLEIFQKKTADRIYTNINNGLIDVNIEDILGSSGIFGGCIGTKKLKLLFDHIPNLFEIYNLYSREDLIQTINNIDGFSCITTMKIVNNIKEAETFINDINPYVQFKSINSQIIKEKKLIDMKIVFSGFRDINLENMIKDNGGKVLNTISKNTNILVISDKNDSSSKINKALEMHIDIILKQDFINLYLQK